MSAARNSILGPQVEDCGYHGVPTPKKPHTGAGQNLSAERRASITPFGGVEPIDIPAPGARPGIVRLTAAGSGAPLQIGPDLIRRVHQLGHGSALEITGFSERVRVLEDPATVNQRRIRAAREEAVLANQHPNHRHADAREQWAEKKSHARAVLDHFVDGLDAARAAYSAVCRASSSRKSPEAGEFVEHMQDAEHHARAILEHATEATHVPAPPRAHLPPARLTYGEPPEAA